MNRRTDPQAGLTLVELMISVVISGIAISAALSMGYSMMNSYRDHKAMVMVERSARVSLEIVGDQVRTSAPGVPHGNIQDLVGCDPLMTGMTIDNSSTGPDALRIIYPAGGEYTSLAEDFAATDTEMEVTDASGFEIGDLIIVTPLGPETDPADGVAVPAYAALMRIVDLDAAAVPPTITVEQPSAQCSAPIVAPSFKQKNLVIRARMARYEVVSDSSVGNVPTLMIDPDGAGDEIAEPVAEGIEDLQIALGYDLDGDGDIDEVGNAANDDEWIFNFAGEALPNPLATPRPQLRAIRLTIVARSVQEQSDRATYFRPQVEDHDAAEDPDPFRRRVLSTQIEIRNLAGSI